MKLNTRRTIPAVQAAQTEGMTRDELTKKLASNPRLKEVGMPGEGDSRFWTVFSG